MAEIAAKLEKTLNPTGDLVPQTYCGLPEGYIGPVTKVTTTTTIATTTTTTLAH
jgi:hypothetical protein